MLQIYFSLLFVCLFAFLIVFFIFTVSASFLLKVNGFKSLNIYQSEFLSFGKNNRS